MHWNSFAEFLAMGHHGPYVWGSVAVMALAMTLEPLGLSRGRRQLISRLKREMQREPAGDSGSTTGAGETFTKETH